jgi:CxxC motif-containing protein
MWFKKELKSPNENIAKVISILSNCHHLVKVDVNKMINKNIDYRFLDMIAGYYWQISIKKEEITIKTGDVVLSPQSNEELFKMLDLEINKSMIYEMQKETLLIKNR